MALTPQQNNTMFPYGQTGPTSTNQHWSPSQAALIASALDQSQQQQQQQQQQLILNQNHTGSTSFNERLREQQQQLQQSQMISLRSAEEQLASALLAMHRQQLANQMARSDEQKRVSSDREDEDEHDDVEDEDFDVDESEMINSYENSDHAGSDYGRSSTFSESCQNDEQQETALNLSLNSMKHQQSTNDIPSSRSDAISSCGSSSSSSSSSSSTSSSSSKSASSTRPKNTENRTKTTGTKNSISVRMANANINNQQDTYTTNHHISSMSDINAPIPLISSSQQQHNSTTQLQNALNRALSLTSGLKSEQGNPQSALNNINDFLGQFHLRQFNQEQQIYQNRHQEQIYQSQNQDPHDNDNYIITTSNINNKSHNNNNNNNDHHHHHNSKRLVSGSGSSRSSDGESNGDDLDRIRNFIEQFKARRGALGLTQKQAAQCFRSYTNDRFAFSDNFVGHFEGFQFRPVTAMQIADSLADWLEFAENETRNNRLLTFMQGKVKETRKRKYEVIRIRDSAKRILVEAFEQNKSPSTTELEILSRKTNIPSRNIEIFFKNRRTSRQYHI